jgi:hypothetical protein
MRAAEATIERIRSEHAFSDAPTRGPEPQPDFFASLPKSSKEAFDKCVHFLHSYF